MSLQFIQSRKNPLIQRVRKLYKSRSFRAQEGLFVCDGFKLLEEARLCGVPVETLLVREDCLQDGRLGNLETEETAVLPRDLFDSLCDVETSPGVLFLAPLPEEREPNWERGGLVLDGLQDPGNLGTILRTADALGVGGVVLTEGCADIANPKTVRATMGACFRVPFARRGRERLVEELKRNAVPLYVADLRAGARDVRQVPLRGKAVVIGSEGPGVSDYFRESADGAIVIPMEPGRESLNAAVAASIVLWEMRRGAE